MKISLIAVSLFCTSCSLVLVNGPDQMGYYETTLPDNVPLPCTTKKIIPVLDGVFGVHFVVGGVEGLDDGRTDDGVLNLAIGGAQLWSAVDGWLRVRDCNRVNAERLRRHLLSVNEDTTQVVERTR